MEGSLNMKYTKFSPKSYRYVENSAHVSQIETQKLATQTATLSIALDVVPTIACIHLLKNMFCYFQMLVLKGFYHYWTHLYFS